jgi:hypothetical protein
MVMKMRGKLSTKMGKHGLLALVLLAAARQVRRTTTRVPSFGDKGRA